MHKFTKVIKYLKKYYGDLIILRIKEHDYLVMYLDFSGPIKVKNNMSKYIRDILK